MSLPAVLRVEQVMARYGMRDERTARRLMNAARAFKVAGRLMVRESDLAAHEERLRREANPVATGPAGAATSSRRAGKRLAPRVLSPADGPDWWRDDHGGGLSAA